MKHNLIDKYLIIETDNNKGRFELDKSTARGFFTSKRGVEKHLNSDALEHFDLNAGGVHEGHDDGWGSDLLVCKVVRVCRQIPIVRVSASIKNITSEESPHEPQTT